MIVLQMVLPGHLDQLDMLTMGITLEDWGISSALECSMGSFMHSIMAGTLL